MKILVFIFIILAPIFTRAGDSFNTKKQNPVASPVISLINGSNYGFQSSLQFSSHVLPEFSKKNNKRSLFDKELFTAETTLPLLPSTSNSSAYQFQKVERRTLTSIGLILVGIPLLAVGIANDETAIFTVGGTAIVAGITIAIAGHYQVIGPGYVMKKNEITITPAEHGFGLALNF